MTYTQKLKKRVRKEKFKENRKTELVTYVLFPTFSYNLLEFSMYRFSFAICRFITSRYFIITNEVK